jgi:hypothetical protein
MQTSFVIRREERDLFLKWKPGRPGSVFFPRRMPLSV